MGYYIRIFGKKDPDIPISIIRNNLRDADLDASITIESGSIDSWELITVADKKGNEIMQVERNSTYGNALGHKELIEVEQEIENYKPLSAVNWLKHFLKTVEVIYAIQVLDFSDNSKGWEIIGQCKTLIMDVTQGIIQADHEGFSNEEGYHILWQFSDSVEGDWHMAILNQSNEWVKFKMDLGDKEHRGAFMDGKIPQGINPID